MRTYEEMVSEFTSFDEIGKEKWINNLTLEEIRNFRNGLTGARTSGGSTWDWLRYWISYIDEVISDKIKELRNSKLNELGI